jgi:hypothetical protein
MDASEASEKILDMLFWHLASGIWHLASFCSLASLASPEKKS